MPNDDEQQSDDIERCGATARSTGAACRHPAGYKTSHLGQGRCHLHGGASPQAEAGGLVRLAVTEAKVLGLPIDVTPHEAILQGIHIKAGAVHYANIKVAELDDAMVGDELHPWVRARDKMLEDLIWYSEKAIKIGIEERLVRTAERYAAEIAEAMRNLAVALGADPDDPQVRAKMRASLTLVAGGLG